ncbi:MAG TPA: ABC-type transport auxiliary lipoprotein family protein [Acetobacteraceae bacterium]|jgi:cholesterol transport system auxiliary component
MSLALSRRSLLVSASCIVPLAGCSVLPKPTAAQIYRLSAPADDPPNQHVLHKRLVVDIPTASESLDTDRIALTRNRTRFDYYADSLWTDRAPLLLQGLLVEAFENDGSIAEVGRSARTLTPDYVLETEIRDFQASYEAPGDQPPAVVITLALSLVRMPDHRMIGQTVIAETSPATHDSLDSVVEAFDVAVGKLLVSSVAWTARTMTGKR